MQAVTVTWSEAARDTLGSWKDLRRGAPQNVMAGVTVAFVALPLNLALAMACGLPPAAGIVTGILAGVLAGMFGGAKLQISGPEVALAPLTYEIVSRHGVKGLMAATFFAGLCQLVFGALRLGRVVQAIPRPVVGGFLTAVGVLVLDAQLPRLLGLPADVRLISAVAPHDVLMRADWLSVVLGLAVIVCFVVLPRLHPRAPGALVGLAVVASAVALMQVSLPTVGSVAVEGLRVVLPAFGEVDLTALLPEAIALALLASIDTLMSAVSIDSVVKGPKHRADQELLAQGCANLVSSLVGGMPVAGAVVRSMAAVQAGATTRLASVSHAGALLLMLLVAAPLVARLPLAGLAGILVVVGVRLINVKDFVFIWKSSRFEALVFVVTAVSILVGDFVGGVATGLVVSLLHFAVQHSNLGVRALTVKAGIHATALVEIQGPIFFASHGQLEGLNGHDAAHPLLLDLRQVPTVDLTGADAVRGLLQQLSERSVRLALVANRPAVTAALVDVGVAELLAGGRIYPTVDEALAALQAQPAARPAPPSFQLTRDEQKNQAGAA
ncbi:MAG: SulP family inorganic anion transporter [Archangium sp.]|nr:SulP family inorganic anion transporter [Archangium sp.]MDP3158273.1 SulP family inorganic anion transporter [Archangium sp.]MDP3569841.1 SulP family inorganic anion transporter [Archangium sp.]